MAIISATAFIARPGSDAFTDNIRTLFGSDAYAADRAAIALGHSGNPDAIPYLIRVAKEYNVPHTRMQSIMAVGRIGTEEGIDALIKQFTEDPYYGVRYSLINALERHDQESAAIALNEMAQTDQDPRIRLRAYTGLIVQQEKVDPTPLFDALQHENPRARQLAIEQLGRVCPLGHVRAWLVEQASTTCTKQLGKLIDDPVTVNQFALADTLEAIGDDEAIALLAEWAGNLESRPLGHPDADVRERARLALETIKQQ